MHSNGITLADMRTQTRELIDTDTGGDTSKDFWFDVDVIAEELRDQYGLVDVKTVDEGDFWGLAFRYSNIRR